MYMYFYVRDVRLQDTSTKLVCSNYGTVVQEKFAVQLDHCGTVIFSPRLGNELQPIPIVKQVDYCVSLCGGLGVSLFLIGFVLNSCLSPS